MGSHIWQRDETWVGSVIEDNMVMVNIDTGKYVTLNASAHAVWQALEKPRAQVDIVGDLVAAFDVDEAECNKSVTGLLEQMRELKLAAPVG
jgi:Coenzyme PQQ synthesis protein D (PqqD)